MKKLFTSLVVLGGLLSFNQAKADCIVAYKCGTGTCYAHMDGDFDDYQADIVTDCIPLSISSGGYVSQPIYAERDLQVSVTSTRTVTYTRTVSTGSRSYEETEPVDLFDISPYMEEGKAIHFNFSYDENDVLRSETKKIVIR